MSEWIDVSDEIPEDNIPVLCRCLDDGNEWLEVGYFNHSYFYDRTGVFLPVSYWMELPEPPK